MTIKVTYKNTGYYELIYLEDKSSNGITSGFHKSKFIKYSGPGYYKISVDAYSYGSDPRPEIIESNTKGNEFYVTNLVDPVMLEIVHY